MTIIEKAVLFAEKAHKDQKYGNYPYMYHLEQVAKIATDLDYDESIIAACYLHDTLEDTSISYNNLKKEFGEEIAEIVYCVTDEIGRNRKERKFKTYPKIRENWKATVVKICDRIANVEHSNISDENLLKMYQKEHAAFRRDLGSKNHPHEETNKAWIRLNSIESLKDFN